MTNLGLLSGDCNWSSGSGINAAGRVVANQEGYSFVYDGHPAYNTSAYISGPHGVGLNFLGTLGGETVPLLVSTIPDRWWGTPTR